MTIAPVSRSQATSSARRPGERTTPVGCWCAGVRTTASAPLAASASTRTPSPSTGTRIEPSPARSALHSASGSLGSSTARRRRAAHPERVEDDVEALGVAGGDQHARRVGDHAADAAEVLGEGGAEDGRAAGVGVGELGVRDLRERGAQRAPPGGAREGGDVGNRGAEVVAVCGRRRLRRDRHRCARRAGRGARDVRARALAEREVALGRELRVRVHGDPTRDAELAGEVAGGGDARAGLEPAVADRGAELVLDLPAQRARAVAGHGEEELERLTGLVQHHDSGSSGCTSEA